MIAARCCLGTAQLGTDYGVANRVGRPHDEACERLLNDAWEAGIRCWDTAPAYGDAERRLGMFLSRRPACESLKVVSKLPPVPHDLSTSPAVMTWVGQQLEESLTRLRIPRLHAWLLHDPTAARSHAGCVWQAMRQAVQAGRVERIGVSVYSPAEAREALQLEELGAMQIVLNLLDSRSVVSQVVTECRQLGVQVFARSPFLQGLFSFAPHALPTHLAHLRPAYGQCHELLQQAGWEPLPAALPFVLSHEEVDFVVFGVDSAEQLAQNLEFAERPFPTELRRRLQSAFQDLPAEWLEPRHWPAVPRQPRP